MNTTINVEAVSEFVSYILFLKKNDPRCKSLQIQNIFNPLAVVGLDEMRISRILSFLFDENNTHNLGSTFSMLFAKEVFNVLDENEYKIKFGQIVCEPRLEQVTSTLDRNRRIDIEIEYEQCVLAIENKPWAEDQDKQVEEYIYDLKRRYKNKRYCLVYLSGMGEDPGVNSIGDQQKQIAIGEGNLKVVSYSKLHDVLDCAVNATNEECVKRFLINFMDYINRHITGGATMAEFEFYKEALLIKEDISKIQVALEVSRAIGGIKRYLIETKLNEIIHNVFESAGYSVEGALSCVAKYECIKIYKHSWKDYAVAFTFDMCNSNGFNIGIIKNVPGFEGDTPRIGAMLGCLNSNEWWLCYKLYDDPYQNWENEIQPWLEIVSEDIGTKLLQDATKYINALDCHYGACMEGGNEFHRD